MKEFGSDFHYIEPEGAGKTLSGYFSSAQLYADGRQALVALYHSQGWRRLWVPEYFCYEVLSSLKNAGVELAFYQDFPGHDDNAFIDRIPFRPGDALMRVNYFGLRDFRNSTRVPVPVVEDHTHDLIGPWALSSQADWCIASLRKTLPVAEGGMLWSPLGHTLPGTPSCLPVNERIAEDRWAAMKVKRDYLKGLTDDKAAFRTVMMDTELYFEGADVSSMDCETFGFLKAFDMQAWLYKKKSNWTGLKERLSSKVEVLAPESDACNPFSLVLLCTSASERDSLRKELIDNQIYPAVLWAVPASASGSVRDFSARMLSLHCDGRYSRGDMDVMFEKLNRILNRDSII